MHWALLREVAGDLEVEVRVRVRVRVRVWVWVRVRAAVVLEGGVVVVRWW